VVTKECRYTYLVKYFRTAVLKRPSVAENICPVYNVWFADKDRPIYRGHARKPRIYASEATQKTDVATKCLCTRITFSHWLMLSFGCTESKTPCDVVSCCCYNSGCSSLAMRHAPCTNAHGYDVINLLAQNLVKCRPVNQISSTYTHLYIVCSNSTVLKIPLHLKCVATLPCNFLLIALSVSDCCEFF